MDLGRLGEITLNLNFLSGILSIVVIDLVLAGDNAVVIAMAVRSLPRAQRRKGIVLGAGAAVLLRVVLTFFISQLLNISYIKLLGGLLLTWIAVRLFMGGLPEKAGDAEPKTVLQVIKIIVIADITMATDNMLAVAGASHGNLFLLIFGLGLSIPLIVFTSNLISMLMDKYPIIIYIGAAILGRVAGEMLITDKVVVELLNPPKIVKYLVEGVFAIGVIIAGKLWMRLRISKEEMEL